MVIAQPAIVGDKTSAPLDGQRGAMARLLATQFGDDRGVMFVDLSRAVNLKDPDLSLDGLHLGPRGNGIIADALIEPVIALSGRSGS